MSESVSALPSRIFRLLLGVWLLLPVTVWAEQPLSVFVSVLPQKYFVQQIGGRHVQVTVMVGPGQSPATFEPRPKQMAALSRARLYYRIGVPFERVWMDRIRAANPGMSILDAREGLQLRAMPATDGHHHGDDMDPHIWLDPGLVRQMMPRLRDRLIQLDPAHGDEYRSNCQRFMQELTRLELDIRQRLSAVKSRNFMVFHPSWGYFAAAFGLHQIAIEDQGKGPGGRRLAGLIERARRDGVRVIFVQRQFSQAQARVLARAIGARVVAIDPLAEEYVENLRQVANAIAEAASE